MLVIRQSQVAEFRRARVAQFVDTLVAYLAVEYPIHCERLGKGEIRGFVERSMSAAALLGIDTEGAIGVLTELRLVYGENLERAPDREWARNILAHKTLPGYIKVEAVQNRLSEKTGGRVLVPFPAP
jgi:hypothetical protein